MKIKRTLYLLHRWFGIVMCLMILLWFLSGLVMMYVEYPSLTEEERLQSKPFLHLSELQFDPTSLEESSKLKIDSLKLTSYLGRPIYQLKLSNLEYGFTEERWLYADNGEPLKEITKTTVIDEAGRFARNRNIDAYPSLLGQIEMDQWTVYGGFNSHQPLYKVALNDKKNTILYISSRTGQVQRDTQGWERTWNWVGSTIHWIYPMVLRKHSNLWVDVVIWVSIAATIAVITGTIVGFLRIRLKKRYKHGRITPYTGMQKWHHLLGLGCTIFVTTFVVSGLFSMNPFGLFDNKTSVGAQIEKYLGSTYNIEGFKQELEHLAQAKDSSLDRYKELEWQMLGGKGLLVGRTETSRSVLNMNDLELQNHISLAAKAMRPNSKLIEQETLLEFNSYYYSTHNRYRPLPALRMVFDDDEQSWYYIDALTGELLNRLTYTDRVYRWLYNGLHSLDFRFLLDHRPLWDIVVILLSLLGIAFSYTSVIIGWRRLKKTKFLK